MKDIYQKLVDLYAGDELPEEMNRELEAEAQSNQELSHDMKSLRKTVGQLKAMNNQTVFTEESNQRILMSLYARGANLETRSPEPFHLQYQLPISSS